MRSNFFTRLYDMLIGDPTEYKKRHTYRVKFNPYWRFHDRDCDRSLQQFHVVPVIAHGHEGPARVDGERAQGGHAGAVDAIKRWVHRDLKNRRRRSRR